MSKVQNDLANSAFLTSAEHARARGGLDCGEKDQTVVIEPGTKLYRIGHYKIHGLLVSEAANYYSPWWMLGSSFQKILDLGQQNPAWAARVSLGIAERWGGDCSRKISVFTSRRLGAWSGIGRAITFGCQLTGAEAKACGDDSASAYWFPDPAIMQYYIPGLNGIPMGESQGLWATALDHRLDFPLLVAGFTQTNTMGQPFKNRLDLKHEHFKSKR